MSEETIVSSTVVGPEGDRIRIVIGRDGEVYRVHEEDVQNAHRWVTSGPFASIIEARSFRDSLIESYRGPVVVEELPDAEYGALFNAVCRLAVAVPEDEPVDGDTMNEIREARRRANRWRRERMDFDTAEPTENLHIVTIQGMLATIRRRAQRPLQCNECGARFGWEDGTEDWEPGQPVDYICQTCPECFGSDVEPSGL